MAKKNYLIFGVVIAVLVVVIIALAAMTKPAPKTNAPANNNSVVNSVVTEEMTVQSVEGESINVVNPGKAVDSSEIAPEQLDLIPLNEEAILTYGVNGLETTTLRARSGARVFLSFIAEDEEQHIFSFADPAMESILVVFSKAEGPISINFLAPGPGTYQYTIDGTETGNLIIE